RLANPYGIWVREFEDQGPWEPGHVDSTKDRWHAGRAMDVLRLPDGTLAVAAESGGIWLMNESGSNAICVSNSWPHSQFESVAQGPDDMQQHFAGGEALYMTNLTKALPRLDWLQLTSLPKQFPGAGFIHDILILRGSRVIVLACEGGVYWSRVP